MDFLYGLEMAAEAGERARARALGVAGELLAELSEKYELLVALGAGEPGRTEVRRDDMRRIAAHYPAALREWDEAAPGEIARRREVVEELLARALGAGDASGVLAAAPVWARAGATLHRLLREVLAVKRWLAGRRARALTPELEVAFGAWHAQHGGWIGPARLADVLAPPSGHVAALAYAETARREGVDVAEVKRALFGHEP